MRGEPGEERPRPLAGEPRAGRTWSPEESARARSAPARPGAAGNGAARAARRSRASATATSGSNSRRYAAPSSPRPAAVSSTERSSTAARPVVERMGERRRRVDPLQAVLLERQRAEERRATAIGWIAEQTSWQKPGSVSSAVRIPPPTVSAASSTCTERPARASTIAAASPFGPAPTTTASASGIGQAYCQAQAAGGGS